MASWSYRKRVTVAPGVKLNISKKGVSTTFGVRGASINVGEKGVYLNTGIPGTGFYRRQKIGGGNTNINPSANVSGHNTGKSGTSDGWTNFFSILIFFSVIMLFVDFAFGGICLIGSIGIFVLYHARL